MARANAPSGSDGCPHPSRREFVKEAGTVALTVSLAAIGRRRALAAPLSPGPRPSARPETAAARFFKLLDDRQRKLICFPFDHPKRSQVHNNWAIVKPTIGDLSGEQRALCREIFKDLCSEEGYDRFRRQMDDDYGGFESYHVALFGEPEGERPFEWVLTGRHATLRADGKRAEGAAFGGPIFYGHAAGSHSDGALEHTDNVWWYPARRANEIFATFDEAQRKRALGIEGEPDGSRPPPLGGIALGPTGLPVSMLDDQQKSMVQQLLRDLTSPFRAFEAEEVRECLRGTEGANKLRLTFFNKGGDGGDDRVRDLWKLEGPAFAWYFHGSPHVHSWVHIDRPAPRG